MKKIQMEIDEARIVARNFKLLALASIITVMSGTIIFHRVENWTWVDSLYFSFVSLTTVGYGDVTPKSDAGKLLAILFLIIGIGIIGAFLNNMFKGVAARKQLKEYEEKQNTPKN